ncbi:MAG: hypothetical protein CMO74_04695 [Verrucomicrobiales bacterium]|nr:hypothetical protein [Verrucomicrobiales bacterium]|tara:strand:+ start:11424 stop:11939 length:516 start_codon:yes stop_codon:yes gene_type:complete
MTSPANRPDTGKSFRQSLRELRVMIIVWACAFVWVIGYCTFNAYQTDIHIQVPWCAILAIGAHAWWFIKVYRKLHRDLPWASSVGLLLLIAANGALAGAACDQAARHLPALTFHFIISANKDLRLTLGLPSWTVYGWLLPLFAANVYTLWFCLKGMKDEPMEAMPKDETHA